MPGLVLVTDPTDEPLTVGDIKAQERILTDAEDALLESYLSSARQAYEKQYSFAFLTQAWDWSLDSFPWWELYLQVPLAPLASVTSITYYDQNNTPTVWPNTEYVVDTAGARIAILPTGHWPSVSLRATNGVVVRFVAGYATMDLLQESEADRIHELVEWVSRLYQNRENGMSTNRGAFAPYA